jgi:hypothetical protein
MHNDVSAQPVVVLYLSLSLSLSLCYLMATCRKSVCKHNSANQ